MIHGIRYICTKDGFERFTQNVGYRTKIHYTLDTDSDSYTVNGYVIAKTFMVIKCICGESHEILITSEHEDV